MRIHFLFFACIAALAQKPAPNAASRPSQAKAAAVSSRPFENLFDRTRNCNGVLRDKRRGQDVVRHAFGRLRAQPCGRGLCGPGYLYNGNRHLRFRG